MDYLEFIDISKALDRNGLVWQPEIGDEVLDRDNVEKVSIFVNPSGLTPRQLRGIYLWLPRVEQLVRQLEARQVLIYHAGITETFEYQVVVKTNEGIIESEAPSLRIAFGSALNNVLVKKEPDGMMQ